MYADQRRFFDYFVKQGGIVLRKGIVKSVGVGKDGRRIYREKRTDVRLALDMYKLALEDDYDVGLLLSGDSDFAEAVRFVQDAGKEIWLVSIPRWRSQHLRRVCNYRIILSMQEIIPYIKKPGVPT